jgi:hypothetical protein
MIEKRDQNLKLPTSKRKSEDTNKLKKKTKTKGDMAQAFTKAEEKSSPKRARASPHSQSNPLHVRSTVEHSIN